MTTSNCIFSFHTSLPVVFNRTDLPRLKTERQKEEMKDRQEERHSGMQKLQPSMAQQVTFLL